MNRTLTLHFSSRIPESTVEQVIGSILTEVSHLNIVLDQGRPDDRHIYLSTFPDSAS